MRIEVTPEGLAGSYAEPIDVDGYGYGVRLHLRQSLPLAPSITFLYQTREDVRRLANLLTEAHEALVDPDIANRIKEVDARILAGEATDGEEYADD